MNTHTPTETFLTRDEAATYIGVSRATLETWASTGRHGLKYLKPFGRVRYRKSDLDDFLARNCGTSASEIRANAMA
ncbi:MAG: helix-turn-helix domain-containing protein [Tepidisphaeraceae bacterium]|jgi:excisionase family DNA binding protein